VFPQDARTLEVLRRGGVVEHPPPPHVWDAVGRAVHAERGTVRVLGGRTSGRGRRQPIRPARTAGAGRLLAAAAAGALVTWAALSLTEAPADGDLLASGQLAPLASEGASGRAEVIGVDGHQRLRVELDERPEAGDGYLEVWLLRPDVSGMVTLGVLEEATGEFLLPEGLDLGDYPVVDISLEHLDGDPGHGGDSLVRGEIG